VSRSSRPSLVSMTPARTVEERVPAGSAFFDGSTAVCAGLRPAREKVGRTAAQRTTTSDLNKVVRNAERAGIFWRRCLIIERKSLILNGKLLQFARADLAQSGGAAQAHVAVGIPALQLLQHAHHALDGRVRDNSTRRRRRSSRGRFRCNRR